MSGQDQEISDCSLMQNVPLYLRERNVDCYKPYAVSIGPFNYGLKILQDVEKLKSEIACKFIEESQKSPFNFYNRVENLCSEAKLCYPAYIRNLYTHKQFTQMFFLDACFVTGLIHYIVSEREGELPLSYSYLRMCMRDFFLLENQIPFFLVDELIKLRFGGQGRMMIHEFLAIILTCASRSPNRVGYTDMLFDQSPRHLLDLLRKMYIGIRDFEEERLNNDPDVFSSAKGLHNRGIMIHRSGFAIAHFKFNSNDGNLYMPPLFIDELFKSTFLNMAAYEASLGAPGKLEVTTYICLLKYFARNSESVDVLREQVVYSNEDNETIVEMFRDMCENLHPNFQLYGQLLNKIYDFRIGFAPFIRFWAQQIRHIVPW